MKTRASTTPPIRKILLVEDHPIMRHGLIQLINHEPDLKVCGEAESANQALAAVAQLNPDLVLVDISLQGRSGLELIKDLRVRFPRVLILVLSMHEESFYAERVLRAGSRGYIKKQEGGEMLIAAIRKVLLGEIYLSEKMSATILETYSGRRTRSNSSPLQNLTDRELEVFQLIGQGKETREIAQQLHLSMKTIEAYRANIKQKLKIKSVSQLISFAAQCMRILLLLPWVSIGMTMT